MKVFEIFPLISFFLILIILVGRIKILKKQGVGMNAKAEKKNKSKLFLYPVFIIILFAWLFEITKSAFRFTLSILPDYITQFFSENLILKTAGAVLILVSLIFLTITLVHFKTSLRFGLDKTNRGKLITTGIFSVSRNPFFLSLILYFVGIAFILPNLFFIGFGILTIVSIHFFILKEEKFMRKNYGGEYEKYSKKVRRYF